MQTPLCACTWCTRAHDLKTSHQDKAMLRLVYGNIHAYTYTFTNTHTRTHTQTHTNAQITQSHKHTRARKRARARTHSCSHTGTHARKHIPTQRVIQQTRAGRKGNSFPWKMSYPRERAFEHAAAPKLKINAIPRLSLLSLRRAIATHSAAITSVLGRSPINKPV